MERRSTRFFLLCRNVLEEKTTGKNNLESYIYDHFA